MNFTILSTDPTGNIHKSISNAMMETIYQHIHMQQNTIQCKIIARDIIFLRHSRVGNNYESSVILFRPWGKKETIKEIVYVSVISYTIPTLITNQMLISSV